jgi:hypothetical protein
VAALELRTIMQDMISLRIKLPKLLRRKQRRASVAGPSLRVNDLTDSYLPNVAFRAQSFDPPRWLAAKRLGYNDHQTRMRQTPTKHQKESR